MLATKKQDKQIFWSTDFLEKGEELKFEQKNYKLNSFNEHIEYSLNI